MVKSIGAVASIIGGIITGYGYWKYNEADGMIRALKSSNELLGTDSSKSINLWTGYADNYKLVLIIGAIILIVGIILFISGYISRQHDTVQEEKNTKILVSSDGEIETRLRNLDSLLQKNLITQDEYEKKREHLISLL